MEILLVIDIQQRYMDNYDSGLLQKVNQRILQANNEGMPVVYVKNMGTLEAPENYCLANDLKVVSDNIFPKQSPSAFSSKDFVRYIKEAGVDTIIVIGVDGRCCVVRTVIDAVEQGIKVNLFLDAVGAKSHKFYTKELEQMKEAGAKILS